MMMPVVIRIPVIMVLCIFSNFNDVVYLFSQLHDLFQLLYQHTLVCGKTLEMCYLILFYTTGQ